jgi:hypothetical protein
MDSNFRFRVRNLGMGRDPLLDVRLALLGYVVEWDKAGLPTAARGEDPKAVIRDPQLNHSIRVLANIDGSVPARESDR